MNIKKVEDKGYMLTIAVDMLRYELSGIDNRDMAWDIQMLLNMTGSCWCYGGKKDNGYIEANCRSKHLPYETMRKISDDYYDTLSELCTKCYGGEDGEGVEYNSIKCKDRTGFTKVKVNLAMFK